MGSPRQPARTQDYRCWLEAFSQRPTCACLDGNAGCGGGCALACVFQIQVEHSTRSTNRSFKRLIKVNNVAPEDIYKAICSQTVELVFTAHPTQAIARITILSP